MATFDDYKHWLRNYGRRIPNCKWFIVRYFGINEWQKLQAMEMQENHQGLMNHLQQMWFELPDHVFNILNDPPGWSDFLHLIENYPQVTNPAAPHDS